MLDMGFTEDVEFILSKTPKDRQTSLFSATIEQSVMRVCNKYMKNPEKILVSKDEIALTQMKQFYTVVNQNGKFGALCDILTRRSRRQSNNFLPNTQRNQPPLRPTLPQRLPSTSTTRRLHTSTKRPSNQRLQSRPTKPTRSN